MERKFFDDSECWIISHDLLCVGDYGGAGSIGEANIRALEDTEGAYTKYGAYSSKQLWLPDTEENRAILEWLDDYLLIDDEKHSEVEADWEKEAWESWLRSALLRTLDSEVRDVAEDWSDDMLWELYREAMEKENQHPTSEYSGVHIPIERIKDTFNELVSDHLAASAQEDSNRDGGPDHNADLGILADWCEETGHPYAEVVRYLADQIPDYREGEEREEEPTTTPSLEG